MKKTAIYLLIIFLSFASKAQLTSSNKMNFQKESRIVFTENKGQISDQHFQPRPDVLFSGSTGAMNYYLKNNGISYQLYRLDKWKEPKKKTVLGKGQTPEQTSTYRLDITWMNSNNRAEIKKEGALPTYNNYYLAVCPNGITNVKSYRQVAYQNLYKGIDLVYYEKDGMLEYDFNIASGADYKQIQLKIDGADNITKNKDGSISFNTALGTITEGSPIVFQNGKQLKANWVISKAVLSFELENYDTTSPATIDPIVRTWGTYFGGDAYESGNAVIGTDVLENVYVAGTTSSLSSIATVGAYQVTKAGGFYDGYLTKYDNAGGIVWSTYYGGTEDDYFASGVIDQVNNLIYAVGNTMSASAISTAGVHQNVYGGDVGQWAGVGLMGAQGGDAMLIQFDENGIRKWGTYYGGSEADAFFSCAVDDIGNIYAVGNTTSTNAIASVGAFQSSFGGVLLDAILVKFDKNGIRQWGTYYGGNGDDDFISCKLDACGNIYAVGDTYSRDGIATAGTHQAAYAGVGGDNYYDGFLVKFDNNGNRIWGTYYGGVEQDFFMTCAIDASGNIYALGSSASSSGISTSGVFQPAYGGGDWWGDGMVVKFNNDGVRQWGTYYGGSNDDYIFSSCMDVCDNLYVAGFTTSNNGIATAGSFDPTYNGGTFDGFLCKLDNNGAREWSTYYGGSGDDYTYACYVDNSSNVYLSGQTTSTSSIATSGASKTTMTPPYFDGFLVKWQDDACTASIPSTITLNMSKTNTLCNGQCNGTANVTANSCIAGTYTYLWNNGATTQTISGLCAGNYTVTVSDANSSSATATIAITEPLPISLNLVSKSDTCNQSVGVASVTASNGSTPYSYKWSNNSTNQQMNNLSSGNYSLQVTDNNGCTKTTSITIDNVNEVSADAGNDVAIDAGASTQLIGTGGGMYSWSPSEGLSCIDCSNPIASPKVTTTYTLMVTKGNGCTAIDYVTVTINIDCDEEVFIPTAFSPNGDGNNDVLFVRNNCVQTMMLSIYSRWGEKVFESDNVTKGWDGSYNGKPLDAGAYFYQMEIILTNDKDFIDNGCIYLMR